MKHGETLTSLSVTSVQPYVVKGNTKLNWFHNLPWRTIAGTSDGCNPKETGCMIWRTNWHDTTSKEVNMITLWWKITRWSWWMIRLFYIFTLTTCDSKRKDLGSHLLHQVPNTPNLGNFIERSLHHFYDFQVSQIHWFISGWESLWQLWSF